MSHTKPNGQSLTKDEKQLKYLEALYELLDEAYEIQASVPCQTNKCSAGCEPGLSDTTMVLLPGEFEYISERLHERAKFDTITLNKSGKIVGLQKTVCPYKTIDNSCKIYDVRPIDCRSYPLMPTTVLGYLGYVLDGKCPINKNSQAIQKHARLWTAFWEKVVDLIDPEWWELYNTTDVDPRLPFEQIIQTKKDFTAPIAKQDLVQISRLQRPALNPLLMQG
jgi:Fe-S-cluster containining protein